MTVLDAVYEPLRLQGETTWRAAERDAVYVLHGPNKALGLCGLRGAYAIAPAGNDARTLRWRAALDVLDGHLEQMISAIGADTAKESARA